MSKTDDIYELLTLSRACRNYMELIGRDIPFMTELNKAIDYYAKKYGWEPLPEQEDNDA